MHPETLRQLIANCRRKTGRALGFPIEWTPSKVKHPELEGYFFTEMGAWEFVADKLEAGHSYEEMQLDHPKGALAIVMKIQLTTQDPHLYT